MTDEAGKNESSISKLPLHDQLLHGIGRVAQAQVEMETALRGFYVAMTIPSTAMYLLGRRSGVDQLAQDCLVLLANSAVPDEVKAAGDQAIRAAIEADKLRHRVVHDRWLRLMDADDPTGAPYRRLRAVKGHPLAYHAEPSDLGFVDDAEAQLRRARIRVDALVSAVRHTTLPGPPPPLPSPDELIQEIRGQFTLLPGGGWRPDEPPSEG